ncbi:hypothetical protein UFOVP1627_29 [uncultured Caudovirales phage]|uniref:Uncharacterized protein n=1 Tax=uncultured Caudovirales phage TaxID=2100421 RepID=A0A6J5QID3_9CAUD|nr:hypothetical protein UFOVP1113_7 [uncultured Caudovirales phage]CAB4219769.1 hypothetical protein UFOVP1627_29 [uncultured Caudovirales phage]CAB5230013.1 hypothetical protein UFOVP1563_47 [uncultured Caudovirales phage]
MPLIEAIAVAVEAVITYIIPEAVAEAVLGATTLIANASTGALISLGIPAELAAGAVTVGGDVAVGGFVGAGLGAGQAALTGENIGQGALMGGVGGAVGLGLGNLASKSIAEQASIIFSRSTSTYIGETVGQGLGGFAGGIATGANLKDSLTMGALGAALGAYSASEINAANAAKLANQKQVIANELRVTANTAFEAYNVTLAKGKGYYKTMQDNYSRAEMEYYNGYSGTYTATYFDAKNKLDRLKPLIKKQLTTANTTNTAYSNAVKDFEAAIIEYDKVAAGFAERETGLVSAYNKEVEYENTLKIASDKAAADKVIADKAAADAAKVAQDAAEKAAATKAAADKVIADKAAADKVIADKAAADATAAAERAAAEHAAAVKAIEDKAAADKVISDKAIADRVAAEKIAADKLASDKAAFEKADAERPVTAEKPTVLGEITVSAEKERPRRLGETITVSAERESPRGFGALTQDYQFGSMKPMELIKEPGTTETPKKTSILGDALTLATLIPGMAGTGGQQGIPLPQGGLQGGLTASGTPGPGSSALAQVLNQGGAGAPVFGTNQDKGKKSKWNLESLRYMGNQDKGE